MNNEETTLISNPGEPNNDSQSATSDSANSIGSRKSAFQPYKPLTILTNLQRGNVKTSNREVTSQALTFHEKAARGELIPDEVNKLNVNSLDETGKTPLIWAASHGKYHTVQMLVEKGANVNVVGRRLDSPLHYASYNGHLSVINYLLSHGADVNSVDVDGNTPLMYATVGNHSQCVTCLLQNGAALMQANYNGDCSFSIAVSKRLLAAQNAMETYLKEFIESNCTVNTNNILNGDKGGGGGDEGMLPSSPTTTFLFSMETA